MGDEWDDKTVCVCFFVPLEDFKIYKQTCFTMKKSIFQGFNFTQYQLSGTLIACRVMHLRLFQMETLSV